MKINEWIRENKLIAALTLVVLVLTVAAVAVWTATSKAPEPSEPIVIDPPTTTAPEPTSRSAEQTSTDPTTEATTEPPAPVGDIGPLTGLPMNPEKQQKRALLVVFDNFSDARPQRGLIASDLGIEILAEGLITRIVGVFYSEYPDKVGPIRSARPYIVEKALEFDGYLAHVGGSMQALSDIVNYQVADLDGLKSGAFNREPPKKPPHNTYAKTADLLDESKRRGYRMEAAPVFAPFGAVSSAASGDAATRLKIVYRSPSNLDKAGYYVTFRYDAEFGLYVRYMNDSPHVDEVTGEKITCANIIVQQASHKVIDDEGRLSIQLTGTGKGHLFSEGKVIPISWKKNDVRDRTIFFDSKGNEIVLIPGKTWIQVVKPDSYTYATGD